MSYEECTTKAELIFCNCIVIGVTFSSLYLLLFCMFTLSCMTLTCLTLNMADILMCYNCEL